MADTAVLEAAAERRGGSSPFVRTRGNFRLFWATIFKGEMLIAFKKRRRKGASIITTIRIKYDE